MLCWQWCTTRIINVRVYEACPYLNWHGLAVNLAKNSTEVNIEQFEGKLYNQDSLKKVGKIFEPFVKEPARAALSYVCSHFRKPWTWDSTWQPARDWCGGCSTRQRSCRGASPNFGRVDSINGFSGGRWCCCSGIATSDQKGVGQLGSSQVGTDGAACRQLFHNFLTFGEEDHILPLSWVDLLATHLHLWPPSFPPPMHGIRPNPSNSASTLLLKFSASSDRSFCHSLNTLTILAHYGHNHLRCTIIIIIIIIMMQMGSFYHSSAPTTPAECSARSLSDHYHDASPPDDDDDDGWRSWRRSW